MLKRIIATVGIFCLLLSVTVPAYAANKIPTLTKTNSTVSGMDKLRFFSISGADKTIDYRFFTADYEEKTYTVFSLEDPVGVQTLSGSLPAHLNENMIKAILAIGAKLNPTIASEYTGVSYTSNEYLASVQVALWKVVSADSQVYKLDPASVKNDHVVGLSDWFISTAQEYLDKKPKDVSVSRYFLPKAELIVNSSNAEGVVEGQFNFYGPYTIESPDLSATVHISGPSNTYSLVNNVSGTVLTDLKINEPFYVRFDKSYTSNVEVNFTTTSNAPLYSQYSNHIFMIDKYEECTAQLIIGNSQTSGTIVYTKTDDVTDAFIPGVVVEIRNESGSLVTTMTTDENGTATSPLLRIGVYKVVEINTAPGYSLDDTIYRADIQGSGQIIRLASKGKANIAFVTFLLQDKANGAPVGGSVFEIINSKGEVETKIGFNSNGRCANIKLPAGKFTLKEIITDPNYELLIERAMFESVAGEVTEVKILKSATFSKTTFIVTDDANTPVRNCTLELYLDDASLVAELKCDNDGKLTIGLPPGTYHVKQASKGDFYSGQTYSFTVNATNRENVVNVGVAKFDCTISGVVFDSQNNPVAGVSLVAVDDNGMEYSTATTNFEGNYTLENLPKGAVIFVTVYKAPYGFTGEVGSNKVITTSTTNAKSLTIKTLEELNSQLAEDQQMLKYNFYVLKSQVETEAPTQSSGGFGNMGSVQETTEPPATVTPEPTSTPEVISEPTPEPTEVVEPPVEPEETSEIPLPALIGGGVLVIVIFMVFRSKKKKPVKPAPSDEEVSEIASVKKPARSARPASKKSSSFKRKVDD